MGFFHCRPINPSEDFILTSPTNIKDLGEYNAYTTKQGWFFCKKCGVRVLGLGGRWEQVDLDVEQWAGSKPASDEKELQKVWKTNYNMVSVTENGEDIAKRFHYLSVNAVTLEPSEDVDLKKWHDEGWVFYVENREKKNGTQIRVSGPFQGGMY